MDSILKSGQHMDDLQVNRDHEGLQAVPRMENAASSGLLGGERGEKEERDSQRRILGLTVATFWVVILVIVLLLAGGIGGGIGGGLAAQKKSDKNVDSSSASLTISQTTPAPTTTPTPTSGQGSSTSTSSASTSGASPIIRTPCIDNPSANSTNLTAYDVLGVASIGSFTLLCNTNYPSGGNYGNPNVTDLMQVWVPDMEACIDQCVRYNLGYAVTQKQIPKCAVAAVVRQPGDYCWLKSATGINNTETSGNGVPIDSAVLN